MKTIALSAVAITSIALFAGAACALAGPPSCDATQAGDPAALPSMPFILAAGLGVGLLMFRLADDDAVAGAETTDTTRITKPGWQTTEFWVSLLTIFSGVLTSLFGGDVGGGQATTTAGGLATAAGALGYAISRGLAKGNG